MRKEMCKQDAKIILEKVYEYDRSSVYSNDENTVHGSHLVQLRFGSNLHIKQFIEEFEISSNWYSEEVLLQLMEI